MGMRMSTPARSLTGSLLASLPALMDPNFRQTVLFLSHHATEEGAVGFILNRPREVRFAELTEVPASLEEVPVFEGGPVGQEGVIVARLEWEDETATFKSLGEQDLPESRNDFSSGSLRAFAGYAGWSPGQLEQEISEGSWAVVIPNKRLLAEVATPAEGVALWKRIMRSVGPWEGLLAEAPDHPELN